MATKKNGKKKKEETAGIQKAGPPAAAVPDYVRAEDANLNIEPGELQIPFVKLLQANSQQVNCEEPLGEKGDFFNTATEENLGKELYFIPVLLNRKRICWKDFDEGGGIECRSYDNKSGDLYGECAKCINEETGIPRSSFGPEGEKPECTKYYDFVSVIFSDKPKIDESTKITQSVSEFSPNALSVISFGTTKIPAARRLIMIAQAKKAALYSGVYKMTRKFVEKKNNSFYVPEVEWFGWTAPDIYKEISENIESLRTLAGNPENYTKEDEEEVEIREEEGHYDPEADDAEDLPFV